MQLLALGPCKSHGIIFENYVTPIGEKTNYLHGAFNPFTNHTKTYGRQMNLHTILYLVLGPHGHIQFTINHLRSLYFLN